MADRVVVVGDACVDVVARLRRPLAAASDTDAVIASHPGGSAANVAAWLAWTRCAVTFVGRVGDDAAGEAQVAALRTLGVDVSATVDPHRPTGTVIALVGADGERSMVADRGASGALGPDDIPVAAFRPGAHLHLSGYVLLHASSRAAGLAALDRARVAGMTMSVDPSSAAPLRLATSAAFLEWTAGAGLLLANRDEAAVLAGGSDVDEHLLRLLAHYPEVVVKLGAAGARWRGASDVAVRAPAVDVVDTTGAGDAFAAGFLSRWIAKRAAHEALAEGVRLAALAVGVVGARPRGADGC